MAQLRVTEERDARGNTTKLNPAITFKQDRQIRVIVGRHDWRLDDNPNYHQPITAQVQDGKIRFFEGVPDSSQTRGASRELKYATVETKNENGMLMLGEVPKYIIDSIKKQPIRVREPRPTVYEVRLATIGDVEVAQTTEIASNGLDSVTVNAIEPDVNPHLRNQPQAPRAAAPIEATL
jgi:hypothetical protein